MTCEQIQNDIALWAGNDLAPQEAEEVRRHLTRCPACRTQAQKLKATLATISRSTPEPTYDSADSLWPAIARRLPHRPRKKPDLAWRKWLPSIAATVVAAGVTIALLLTVRPWLKKRFTVHEQHLMGAAAQIGRSAVALDRVTPSGGRVKLSGEMWSARTLNGSIEPGEEVIVDSIDGATAVVSRARVVGS